MPPRTPAFAAHCAACPGALDRRTTVRRRHDQGLYRSRFDGEVVATRASYESEVGIQVYGLSTRVPFRRRRIASFLLRDVLEHAGARFVLISCDPAGRPIELYRRLGFTEPVYWRRIYARRT